MNTRSFIRSLIAGCIAPTIFIPTLYDNYKWKRCTKAKNLWIPNPDWETANGEIAFCFAGTINMSLFTKFYKDYSKASIRDLIILRPIDRRITANEIKLSM